MLAKRERIVSISEKNNKIEVLVDEERSQQIDGAKLFEIANTFGRGVQLGTEKNKLKLVFKYTKDTEAERYSNVAEFMEKLTDANRKS